MIIAYADISTMVGSQRVFGIYDKESKAIFVLENNAISINYVSYNKAWQVLPDKWIKTYQKWIDVKDKYNNKSKPKNLIFAESLFSLIDNKEMVIERGRENHSRFKEESA